MRKVSKTSTALLTAALLLCGAVPASASAMTATSLGDSFNSGEGGTETGSYLPGSDTATNQCHRARTSPPALVATMRRINLDDLSCSGATTADLLTTSRFGEPPQISQIKPYTRLVMVMVGGNDMEYGRLFGCFLQYDCDQTTLPSEALDKIDQLEPELDKVFTGIRAQAPYARVVVQLYPKMFPPTDSPTTGCPWLNPGEHGLGNAIQFKLNSTIARQAKNHNFQVANASYMFRGHDLCAGDQSWFYAVGAVPPAAVAHPNLMGRRAMAAEYVWRSL